MFNFSMCDSNIQYEVIKSGQYTGKENQVIFRMVYDFAEGLPYSMDLMQPEYVPSDFLHMFPISNNDYDLFSWTHTYTVRNAMASWGDTKCSAVLLTACAIFQKMLEGKFPSNYSLQDSDAVKLQITNNSQYNSNLFDVLKLLPVFYKNIQSTTSDEQRRVALESIYKEMNEKIANRLGGFRETDSSGKVIRDYPASIICNPDSDIHMLYYFNRVPYSIDIEPLKKHLRDKAIEGYTKKIGSKPTNQIGSNQPFVSLNPPDEER